MSLKKNDGLDKYAQSINKILKNEKLKLLLEKAKPGIRNQGFSGLNEKERAYIIIKLHDLSYYIYCLKNYHMPFLKRESFEWDSCKALLEKTEALKTQFFEKWAVDN